MAIGTEASITILHDREPVPDGCVTFGQLITEARDERKAERELDKRTRWHHQLHARYCRRFRVTADLMTWERYVCRVGEEHGEWFASLTDLQRLDLCDASRAARRAGRLGWKKKSSGR